MLFRDISWKNIQEGRWTTRATASCPKKVTLKNDVTSGDQISMMDVPELLIKKVSGDLLIIEARMQANYIEISFASQTNLIDEL